MSKKPHLSAKALGKRPLIAAACRRPPGRGLRFKTRSGRRVAVGCPVCSQLRWRHPVDGLLLKVQLALKLATPGPTTIGCRRPETYAEGLAAPRTTGDATVGPRLCCVMRHVFGGCICRLHVDANFTGGTRVVSGDDLRQHESFALAENLAHRQLPLGHTKMDSTVRYLGVDIEDELSLSEAIDL
jgi:hypothetical protein